MLKLLKNGSGIHIKESHKGLFTKYCNGKVTDECIRKGKNSSNPAVRKRATFADNARHFKHEDGGRFDENKYSDPLRRIIKKHQTGGTVDLTPVDLQAFYNNYKRYGNNRFIDTLLLRQLDNRLINNNMGLPLRLASLYTTLQEGNRLGPHGNGASGALGWRGDRALDLPATAKGQADKIYNETYGDFDPNNWNHGGKGSGYNSGKDALKAFINAQTVEEATRALNYGYVRPPKSDSQYRTASVKKMFRKGGLIKAQEGAKFNWGLLLQNTGTTVLSTIAQNKEASAEAEKIKALNLLEFSLALLLLNKMSLLENENRYLKWQLDYLSGKTLDLPSKLVTDNLAYKLLSGSISQLSLDLKNKNKIAEVDAKNKQSQNWTNSITTLMSDNMGLLGSVLGGNSGNVTGGSTITSNFNTPTLSFNTPTLTSSFNTLRSTPSFNTPTLTPPSYSYTTMRYVSNPTLLTMVNNVNNLSYT